jgi:hypothetical protein
MLTRSVDMVGNSSVGFGPIDLKIGMWVWEVVTHEEKWVPNCYSMFRAKSVDMVGTSSVGFGPIDLKIGMWVCDSVCQEEKWVHNCYPMFRDKSVDMVDTSSACKEPKGPKPYL